LRRDSLREFIALRFVAQGGGGYVAQYIFAAGVPIRAQGKPGNTADSSRYCGLRNPAVRRFYPEA
jgi:hypothetical protein